MGVTAARRFESVGAATGSAMEPTRPLAQGDESHALRCASHADTRVVAPDSWILAPGSCY
jgi:hypothetical protein